MHIGTYYLYRLEQARTRISVICKYMWLESKWVLICYCSLSLANFYVNSYNETQLRACLIFLGDNRMVSNIFSGRLYYDELLLL